MTQAEKLEALIRKAIDGGWDLVGKDARDFNLHVSSGMSLNHPRGSVKARWTQENPRYYDGGKQYLVEWDISQVVFSRDFARALFGEEKVEYIDWFEKQDYFFSGVNSDYPSYVLPAYIFHLQQAVISNDPISYLYGAVFGGKDA